MQLKEETLLGKSIEELTNWVELQGQPNYRGKQLHQWLYRKGIRSFTDISVFPKSWRKDLEHYPIGRSAIHDLVVAPDKTRKYLLSLKDGSIIETVGIPTPKRLTVCVSSQVGCPMSCDFCATGKGTFKRNLTCGEIIDQILTVQEDFQRRVSHVVFMGMGEPLLNMEEVIKAIKIINQDIGIGQRSLTVSTVGIPKKILEFANYKLQITFAVSLHASNQILREQLIPTAKSYPLSTLLSDCKKYVEITKRRLTFEYILLEKINDSLEQAVELAKLLKGFQNHVNLIPYNPIEEVKYQRSSSQRIKTFSYQLEKYGIPASIRYSRGLETHAACGQLRASNNT
ncbi:MAG: 23S rRNA m(2)A-2503 methyltransferase [Candidatus Atelocyanobacterium thalassa isolate SIO64986]|uniref:Probable dual-specificity RNA methyltransferase RlmN n=1 Tax=Candidatus Atelocyanobacterium thalassa isolate SIO64986 TaxID=1527444 RepID=A0A086CH20_9CHRO|nr:MAG: 23S rRNA m(2)A-2503 methyltransferase [Candidatus Atelocyanobacterium thalassa isolate SIO64986]